MLLNKINKFRKKYIIGFSKTYRLCFCHLHHFHLLAESSLLVPINFQLFCCSSCRYFYLTSKPMALHKFYRFSYEMKLNVYIKNPTCSNIKKNLCPLSSIYPEDFLMRSKIRQEKYNIHLALTANDL